MDDIKELYNKLKKPTKIELESEGQAGENNIRVGVLNEEVKEAI